MSVIVTDAGFRAEDWTAGFDAREALADPDRRDVGLDLAADLLPEALDALAGDFDRIALIRIPFASFADGRGFTLARHLRLLGYARRLRASGHVIADQYAMARRSGFDEFEIGEDLAARQPEGQWRARADWRAHDYRSRLGGACVGLEADPQVSKPLEPLWAETVAFELPQIEQRRSMAGNTLIKNR